MYKLIKPLLFQLEAESSHEVMLATLAMISKSGLLTRLFGSLAGKGRHSVPVNAMGIDFPNPVGLAAGLDKQGTACNALHQTGFGWLELGTVTPQPQPGNPKPGLFRLPEHAALINRLGFNSVGLDQFVKNLRRVNPEIIKGINIGKNAATPLSDTIEDYLIGLRGIYNHADYVAINISSPNTRHLRELQHDENLDKLLSALNAERQQLTNSSGKYVPLVVKISPDLDRQQIDSIANTLRKNSIDGVAATNTTISRQAVEQHPLAIEVGGLSGRPLRNTATEVIAILHENLQDEITIIGIGGIENVESAREKLDAGAKLIQLYTGFIYRGPELINEILTNLHQ